MSINMFLYIIYLVNKLIFKHVNECWIELYVPYSRGHVAFKCKITASRNRDHTATLAPYKLVKHYIMALPTKGRVIIDTTVGELDIELWSKVNWHETTFVYSEHSLKSRL